MPVGGVGPGTALRIMTGAPLPPGADAVVPFEDTDEATRKDNLAQIGVLRKVRAGWNIRRRGEDLAWGSLGAQPGDGSLPRTHRPAGLTGPEPGPDHPPARGRYPLHRGRACGARPAPFTRENLQHQRLYPGLPGNGSGGYPRLLGIAPRPGDRAGGQDRGGMKQSAILFICDATKARIVKCT